LCEPEIALPVLTKINVKEKIKLTVKQRIMKNTIVIGVLLMAGFLYACQNKSTENNSEVITVSEAPDVEGTATDIANTWCELTRQEFRAKNGNDSAHIATAEKVVKDYQRKVEEKFVNDPAKIESIIAEMISCDAALEGRNR